MTTGREFHPGFPEDEKGIEMEQKRVLVIAMCPYNTLASSNMRMLAMMKGLDELGYGMDLLATPEDVVTTVNDLSDYEFLDRVRIITTGNNELYERIAGSDRKATQKLLNVLRKVYHRFSMYTNKKKVAQKVVPEMLPQQSYDIVISVSDPKVSHIALLRLRKLGLKCRCVIEYWGDPMLTDIARGNTLLPRWYIKKAERKFLKAAEKVVYTSPFTLEMEQKAYPKLSERMIYVPTANAFRKIYPETKNEIFTVGYYGAYTSHVRNILPLYEAFASLRGEAKLNLVGNSDLNLAETDNVMIRERGVVKDLEAETDLFICLLNSSGTQLPGKLYHNAATNRPLLVLLDGEYKAEIREYLEQFNRFLFCENNADAIADAIRNIRRDPGKWEPCPMLDPKKIAAKIIE